MLRLNRYILMLVVWLAFVFNIERLDLNNNNPDVFNIASPIYITITILVLLGITLPQWRRVPLWRMLILAGLSWCVGLFLSGREIWGGAYTYISLFELTASLITVTLAYMVGRMTADFVETVRSLMFSDINERVYAMDEAEPMIKREMQFARRANRPLTVMLLDTNNNGLPLDQQIAAREIQQLLARRHSLVALTRLLARTLRRTDFVLDQTEEGRLVLVMPEMKPDQTQAITQRLKERAQRRLGISIRCSVASFPEEGVTFEELVYQAEQGLRANTRERRGDSDVEQTEAATEKLPILDGATVIQVGAEH